MRSNLFLTTGEGEIVTEYLKKSTPNAAGAADQHTVRETVSTVIADVRERGDAAVREYSEKFDGWSPERFRLDRGRDRARSSRRCPTQVIDDIRSVQASVRDVRPAPARLAARLRGRDRSPASSSARSTCPIDAAGAYVPGGRYPLTASAHMTVVTAKVAGVERVTACTPPIRGEIPAATIAAMHLAGADEIFLLGGVQAVAAMALGTETIGKVDLLAGPGNAYVAEAKRQLFGEVGIDLFAGPTEILVVADDARRPVRRRRRPAQPGRARPGLAGGADHHVRGARPRGHRRTSTALLPGHADQRHGRAGVARPRAGRTSSTTSTRRTRWPTSSPASTSRSSPQQPREALERMRNYGALFLGEGTCVSYGDKVIGTNHVLPTRGAARYTGGLWVGQVPARPSPTRRSPTRRRAPPSASSADGAARVELFEGHARSGDVRAASTPAPPSPGRRTGRPL